MFVAKGTVLETGTLQNIFIYFSSYSVFERHFWGEFLVSFKFPLATK